MDNKFLTILGVVTAALGVGSFVACKTFGTKVVRIAEQEKANAEKGKLIEHKG